MDRTVQIRDEWIALRCQSGEPGGFEDLIAEMERPLLYYAIKVAGNEETALDILQDVWTRAFTDIVRLQNPASLRPWLYRIAHGIAVDRVRSAVSRERAEAAQIEGLQELTESPDEDLDAEVVHEALNQIAIKHREVLVLHFLEDFSLTEISEIVGCSEGTVKSRLHYGKKAMKEILLRGGYANTR